MAQSIDPVDGVNFRFFVETAPDVYTPVLGELSSDMSMTRDDIEKTNKDSVSSGSGKSKEYHPTFFDMTGTVNGWISQGDGGIAAVENALFNGAYINFQYKAIDNKMYQGNGLVTNFDPSAPHDTIASFTFGIKASSGLSKVAAT